jgi:hypothetical protein
MGVEFEGLRLALAAAGAEPGDVVMFGSVVMLLHGLREEIGDIDLFVSRRLYDELKVRGWIEHRPRVGDPPFLEAHCGAGVPVHAFYAWTERDSWVCAAWCRYFAEEVEPGLPSIPLWLVRVHKAGVETVLAGEGVEITGSRWEKHAHDLALLDAAVAA